MLDAKLAIVAAPALFVVSMVSTVSSALQAHPTIAPGSTITLAVAVGTLFFAVRATAKVVQTFNDVIRRLESLENDREYRRRKEDQKGG